MLEGTGYNGQSLDPGEEYEVDEKTGRIFVQLGRAQRVDVAPDVIAHGDPPVTTRDPRPRRVHAAR